MFVIDLAFSKLFATDELVGTGFILTAREITFFNIFATDRSVGSNFILTVREVTLYLFKVQSV